MLALLGRPDGDVAATVVPHWDGYTASSSGRFPSWRITLKPNRLSILRLDYLSPLDGDL
jgi:hypothetical protein